MTIYFGRPGAQISIPDPRNGVQSTRSRPASTFVTGNGGVRASRLVDGRRQFSLNWQQLWYETYATLEGYYHGHEGPGPFVLHDPGRINLFTVNQSSATSHRNDADEFSLVGAWQSETRDPGLYTTVVASSYASTPDAADVDITGDLGLLWYGTLNDYTSGASQRLIGKVQTSSNTSYGLYVSSIGALTLQWSADGSTVLSANTSITSIAVDGQGIAFWATLDVNNGLGGYTVTFYRSTSLNGPWTQIAQTVTTAGTTSVFSGTAAVEVGSRNAGASENANGVTYAAEVRASLDTTQSRRKIDFTAGYTGQTSFTDISTPSATWTVGANATIVGSAPVNLSSAASGYHRGPRALEWNFSTASSAEMFLDSPTAIWPGIPVVAGQALCFSAYATGWGVTDPTITLTPKMRWYDTAGSFLSTTTGSPLSTAASTWAQIIATATPPAGAAYVLCSVLATGVGAGASVHLDEFQLQTGSTPTAWRPGTGVFPVSVMSLTEQWPWSAADYRQSPTLVLQEVGP